MRKSCVCLVDLIIVPSNSVIHRIQFGEFDKNSCQLIECKRINILYVIVEN